MWCTGLLVFQCNIPRTFEHKTCQDKGAAQTEMLSGQGLRHNAMKSNRSNTKSGDHFLFSQFGSSSRSIHICVTLRHSDSHWKQWNPNLCGVESSVAGKIHRKIQWQNIRKWQTTTKMNAFISTPKSRKKARCANMIVL